MTIRCIELVGKKEFAAVVLDPEYKIFTVYVASFSFTPLTNAETYPFCRSQIANVITEETFTKFSIKYAEFVDMFNPDLAFKVPNILELTIMLLN